MCFLNVVLLPQEVGIHRNAIEGKRELPRLSSLGPGSEHLHGHPSRVCLFLDFSLNMAEPPSLFFSGL